MSCSRPGDSLMEEMEPFRLLTREAGIGLWRWDLRSDCVSGLDASECADCRRAPTWEGSYEEWCRSLHPDDRRRVLAAIQAHLEGRVPVYESEHRERQPDGTYRWVLVRGVAVHDDKGNPDRMMGTEVDVTDRRRVEEQARQEQETLRAVLDLYKYERQLLGYEIHDGLAQDLAAALFALQALEHLPDKNGPEAIHFRESASRLIRRGLGEARRLIGNIQPPVLKDSGVNEAIRSLVNDWAEQGGPQIEYFCDDAIGRLASPLEYAIYRIVQESLTNAVRHSQSPRIEVRLVSIADCVRLSVQDWGVGFRPESIDGKRYGLRGIHERAQLLGGRAEIHSQPGAGTRICVELPRVESDSFMGS